MSKLILHIPHSSITIPDKFYERDIVISREKLHEFNLNMTDLYTNELFNDDSFASIIFDYSRVFCDVEKFADDSMEPMSKYGMGTIYTKTNNNEFIGNVTTEYKNYVLENVYYPYHKDMTDIVNELLKQDDVIMIDCHSFSKEIIMTDTKSDLPDICIGINNDDSTELKLTSLVEEYFKSLGYSVKINYPYSGTMVPNNLKKGDKNFYSLMIEINKNIYLENNEKSKNFDKLKEQILNLFQKISYNI